MKDLRSKEARRDTDARIKKERVDRDAAERRRAKLAVSVWSNTPWQLIETCRFEDYQYEPILVSDGTKVAIAEIHKRYGRPMRVIKEPEMAMTDNGLCLFGGEYEEINAPVWWFDWEFVDAFGHMNYAGGEEIGKDEVSFIPTRWMPLPPSK